MRPFLLILTFIFSLIPKKTFAASELASNLIASGVVLGALGIAHLKGDGEGKKQWAANTASEVFVNSTARILFNGTDLGQRPNGKEFGFPSGHMGFATSGAAFLHLRYGWQYGLPALALSGYVAFERVDSDYHYWRDIVAGATIAYGVAAMIVTRRDDSSSSFLPLVSPEFAGISFGWKW